MKLSINFDGSEVETVKRIIGDKLSGRRQFVQHRYERNVVGPVPEIDDDALWMAHIMCLLTTQQRSGPNSAINLFLDRRPFPLSLLACRGYDDLPSMVFRLLTDASGIRRTNKIARSVHYNLLMLEQGEWDNVRRWRDKLVEQRTARPSIEHRAVEEDAADYMNRFLEFGPKQSRNFWQSLGLTRYTFVLDSRILRWLRQNLEMKPGLLTSQGLGDNDYYRFISDILLDLCNQAEVLPCMFDAAVFDSFDEATEWTADVIW